MVQAYVALGANLGNPQAQVRAAMRALDTLAQTRVTVCSPLYLTPPWGMVVQPAFVNAVAGIETALSAHALLASLQTLESRAGRTRDGQRWGPRVLDLDLLLYGDAQYQDKQLAIPHPRLAERAFVLLPLADIAATLEVPGQGRVTDLLSRVDTRGCQRLADPSPS
ncbi:MAG TPA: 2-amino-4-hydroxy-6-hydroxymethyldihydropteridine diphosphokinase [Oleiagrimonas sp.]|nr:2-amino-4-hydroxy-6-hydroxymethyldihydropteridine diphosphokinase [Oleiagrimonas sp.]